MKDARITIFAGHYGSGKTSLAVSYALWLRQRHENVLIADLDIVNPYFRTKDSAEALEAAGIRLISSRYANTNVDVPSMPAEANAIFDGEGRGIIDLGGDDRGALAFGRYADKFAALEEEGAAFLVVNLYRPLSRDTASVLEIKEEIERAAHFHFAGIINNSNLGAETKAEDILNTLPVMDELAAQSGLPVVMTSVRRELARQLQNEIKHIFPMDLEECKWQAFQR